MNRRRHFIADDSGFTMVSIIITMMILSMFAVGAWAATNGDMPLTRNDTARKRAYEAAESGIQWYMYQLERDTNYWTYCNNASKVGTGVNLKGSRTSWRTLPNSQEQFAVELIPNAGKTCSESDPSGTMLNQGILRIRSTGRYGGEQRQIAATFRRSSFLDYIYFTKWETLPPAATSNPTWTAANCDKPRSQRSGSCTAIQFPSGDVVKGPLHTEDDSLLICGTPQFGRNATDGVEVARATSSSTAFKQNGGCSGSPVVKGTLSAPSKSLDLPTNNQSLATVANLKYTGSTCLVFNGNQLTVYANQTWGTNRQLACKTATQTLTLTSDTVIWVSAGAGCTGIYDVTQDYGDPSSCGHVAVSGTYSTNVTIGAANDIIVNGDIKRSGDALMGLVANGFVRVYHPVTRDSSGNCNGNALGTTPVTQIDAAILATTGSFITDNWACGSPLGTLTVNGAITQYWRGAVGTGSASSPASGYLKNYNYDDRLRYREPPQFLDPVTSSWNLLRESEQSPVQTG